MTISIGGVASSYNASPNSFYDVPTNPRIYTAGFSFQNEDKLFTIIYEDGSVSNDTFERPTSSGDIHSEYSNLHATDGFSIRCFDSHTNTGLNLSSINLANNDFFVLLHSDNKHLYHFAKITKIVSADTQGDKFEFSPRLGNEVAKGVKFKVFKGPSNTDKIVAVSAGIDQEIGDTINNVVSMFNIARPFFYFYNDKLDKKNELNHNTKYMLRMGDTNSNVNSVTINTHNHVFTTVADHRYKIVDYSKFTYNIKLEDKLKLLDDPDDATSNESSLLAGTFTDTTDYNNCFINARRDANDDPSSLDLTGPKRYVYYNFSPEDNNRMPIVYECNIADSFDAKTGYASLKLIDSTKNLSNKVFNNDRLFVNQKLNEENLNDWVEVAEIVSNNGLVHTLRADVERPNLYFSVNNEVKIGNTICIVNGVSSTNEITLWNIFGNQPFLGRLETESVFTFQTGVVFAEGTKVYRRRLNPVDNTFFTETNISGDKLGKLNAIIISNQYTNFYCRMGSFISNADEDYGLLTLTFENNLMDNETALRYVFGEFLLNYQIFFGKVEQINKTLENQQSVFQIQGRNTLSKLVDIIINKDTLFSADFITTGFSPYNDISLVGQATWGNGGLNITFTSGVTLSEGDHLWSNSGYIGQVSSSGSNITSYSVINSISHENGPTTNDKQVYKETNKHYIFGKAMASNSYTNSVTSLAGASDKGLFFNDGMKLSGTKMTNLIESTPLVGSAEDTHIKAQGFNISKTENLLNDLPFQATVDGFTDEVVNTLIDFTVIEVNKDKTLTTVKLAPYMPLTLGRETVNYLNFEAPTLASLGNFSSYVETDATNGNRHILLTTNGTYGHSTSMRVLYYLRIGDPLFVNNQFIGRFTGYQTRQVSANNNVGNVADSTRIFIDRPVSLTVGDTITCLFSGYGNRNIPLHLVNGAHLHLNKMIGLIGQRASGSSVRKYNYKLDYLTTSQSIGQNTYTTQVDNIKRYNDQFYRIFNLEKGQIGDKKYNLVNVKEDTIGGNSTPLKGVNKPFYSFSSIFNYYADTYNKHPNFGVLNTIERIDEASVVLNRPLPIGQRGVRPITYSNFADKKFVPPTSKSLIGTVQQSCTTTNSSADVDVQDSSVLLAGMSVGGVNIPSGTTIQQVVSSTEITLSANATGSATNLLTFIPVSKTNTKDNSYQVLLPNTPSNIYGHKPKAGSGIESIFNPLLVRDKLHQIDNRAARLFLYGNRDIEFYTSRRTDSLLNSATRTLSSYGLFSIDAPISSSHSVDKSDAYGNTVSNIHFDTSYKHSNIINSNKTLSNLKRFSLMRLTECVYDSFFNPINPEFEISEDASVESTVINSIKVHETPEVLTAIPAIGSNDLILSASPTIGSIGINDFIYDRLTNKIVGRVTALNGATITCGDGLFYTRINNGQSTSTANQHYTSTSEDLSGFAYIAGDNLLFIKNADVENPITIGGREVGSILYEYPMGANNFTDFRFKASNIHLLYGTIMTQDDRFTGSNDPLGQTNADNRITPSTWSDYYIEQSTPAADFPIGMRTIRKTNIYDNQSILLPYAFFGANNNHPTNASGTPQPANSSASDPEGFWRVETVDASSNNTIEHWNYYGDFLYNQQGGIVGRLYRDINDFDMVWFLDRLEFNQGTKTDDRLVSSIKVVNLKPIGTGSEDAKINSHMVSPFCTYASLGYVFRHGNIAINTGRSIVYPMLGTAANAGHGIPTESADKEATTISGYMGIKFHLDMTNQQGLPISSTGANSNFNHSIFMKEENTFLKNVDLTGCYLVPVGKGKKYIRGNASSSSSFSSDHELMHDDDELIYVVAHENDITTEGNIQGNSSTTYGNRCRIITDKALSALKYKILQPNPVCFWDKTPKEIKLNTLTSAYTKNMDNENMISEPPSWSNYLNSEGDGISSKEGIQSMYVIADLDNLGGQHDLVVRKTSALATILNNLEGEFCLSDGDNSLVCNVRGIDQNDNLGYYLELAEIKKLNGIISVSETFELSVNGDIDEKATRAVIGTTVDICKEIEENVEELLIENDIDFELTKEDYKLFASPDFQGTNLFNLLNYLLKLKDKKMVNIEGQIKIINYDDSAFNAQYSFTDDDITEINTTTSNFNYFNEVIVYGSKHKAIRKDFREIKKNGKKTLEIFEDKLTTKEDVEREAQEKLIIHTQLQELIECKIPVSKIKCLDVGETIILQSKVAGIEPRPFMILEKLQSFDGLVKLKLGKYIKGIEDTIADLLLDSKQTKSYIRNKNFNVNENAFDFFDGMKINEMHLLIRKKEVSGAFTLGFGTQLNTNTQQLGFGGGSITFTTLKETDL